ncbi:MAG: recombinase family protein [Magnetococcales bacterium]|nr:recombinase family protein [Magnetococcales bacterium]
MSTEHQQYSTENQKDVIAQYAVRYGMEIVRTYADNSRSGLKLEGREGFLELLRDVSNGNPGYEVLLVYDVSRWGRYQDTDESAYHEFLIRKTGIRVEYCAEQFNNDGSMTSNIVKHLMRFNAGDYSRVLSIKVFQGQCRLIGLGFRQGGMAGYGLRRMLLDQHGEPQRELKIGDRKSLQTERVILVPGPEGEVAVVQRMYRLFVLDGRSESEIAAWLNREGVKTDLNAPWSRGTVHQVLTNEKYIGNNVFNRTSFKLKQQRTRNPPEMWIRAEGAFQAIVDPELFHAAQTIIAERDRRFTDQEMLDLLAGLLRELGLLSGMIIDEAEALPSSGAFRHRFGSLLRAYRLVGYDPGRDYRYIEINRQLRRLHPEAVAQMIAGIEGIGGVVKHDPVTDLLTVNREFTVSLVIARHRETLTGASRWFIRFDTGLCPDISVVARMAPGNTAIRDYYLLPALLFDRKPLRLEDINGAFLDAFRFDDLSFLFALARRVRLREAA